MQLNNVNAPYSFSTSRLDIIPICHEDFDFYKSLYSCKRIMRLIGQPLSYCETEKAFTSTLKQMDTFIANGLKKTLTWCLKEKATSENIGIVSLKWPSNKSNSNTMNCSVCPEIGIMLSVKANRKNYHTESFVRLIKFAFYDLNARQVVANFNCRNIPVERFIANLGFKNTIQYGEMKTMALNPSDFGKILENNINEE